MKLIRDVSFYVPTSLAVVMIGFNSMNLQFRARSLWCRSVMTGQNPTLLWWSAKCATEAGCTIAMAQLNL